jgi:hypothetical protein
VSLEKLCEFLQRPDDDRCFLLEGVVVAFGKCVLARCVGDRVFATLLIELEDDGACAEL